jgi:hypothetical protein
MYTSVDFTSQIARQRGVSCPTNKEVPYTNLVFGLVVTLKIDYYCYIILFYVGLFSSKVAFSAVHSRGIEGFFL